jgi:hypothetical protein
MLVQYSADAAVNAAVAKLVASNTPNPYSGNPPTPATIAVIKQVIAYAYGEAKAKRVRITIH